MHNRTRAKLVATPDQAVNNYLRIAATSAALVPQRNLEDAETSLTRAQERDREHRGFNGTAEHRQRCERSYDKAKRAADLAWRIENAACDAARGSDPAKFELAANEVASMWRDYYARNAAPTADR
ncbi:hypothetical protein [Streptosporangium lutulentum]|uniref:Uncharacterized protein n=1 Tax=Streptosporangium lutulentum TaxID=1461250 RepID=A0ABT9Q9D1_9ACTN|nr:hypothetical protein [Streptosporangium lutulentum]MDP9843353.1 hypothetical protein [Streptosporangium lutulentum]